jgi:hypothetical protein
VRDGRDQALPTCQREPTTRRDADDREPIESELVGHRPDIAGPVERCPTRLEVGTSEAGTVDRDHTKPEPAGGLVSTYRRQARRPAPVERQDHLTGWVTPLSERQRPPVRQTDGPTPRFGHLLTVRPAHLGVP